MDGINGITFKFGAEEAADDWRAEFTPDMRQRILKRIVSLRRRMFPDPGDACQQTKMCLQLENSAFCNATTKDVYLQIINNIMMQMDQLYHCNVATFSSNPGLTQTSMVGGAARSPRLQNVSWVSHVCAGDSVGRRMKSNISAITQREIPGSQPPQKVADQQLQMQDVQRQFLKWNVHQPDLSTSLIQLDNQNNHQHQQRHSVASQSSSFHCSQHIILPIESQQPLFKEQLCSTVFPQNQLLSQEGDVEQEQLLSKQTLQQSMQPVQFYQPLGSHNQIKKEAMQQTLQRLAALLWPRNIVNQQQLLPPRTTLAELSFAAGDLPYIAELHNQAYQVLQSLKEEYVPRLRLLLSRLKESCDSCKVKSRMLQGPELLRYEARKLIDLLSMSRSDIIRFSKSSFEFFHKTMIKFLYILEQSSPYSVQQDIVNSYRQQLKHQMVQTQNFRQHIQPHCTLQKVQMLMKNFQPVATSGVLQPVIPHQHLATCRQTPWHSSQTGQQSSNLLSPSKTASPSTPSTLFTKTDNAKHPSVTSPLPIPKYWGPPRTTFAWTQVDTRNDFLNKTPPPVLPGKSAVLLSTELTSPNGNQQSSIVKKPLHRLIEAVDSLTPEVLSASVGDIVQVMNEVDMIAGTACSDSGATVGANLALKISCHLHARYVSLQYGCSSQKRMKRKMREMALLCDLDSTENSRKKRRRIERNHALLDEIRSINQWLLETVIELDSTEDAAAPNVDQAIVVRCAYSAVALNENLKKQLSSWMLPVLPLRMLVPASYPNSSPIILNGSTFESSFVRKESLDIAEKTKLRFSMSLRKLSEPMSLAEIAMTWDTCARAVLLEHFQQVGAGCFSSRYGTVENCVT